MRKLLYALILLESCGQQLDSNSATKTQQTLNTTETTKDAVSTTSPTSSSKNDTQPSVALPANDTSLQILLTGKTLPTCKDSEEGKTIYLEEEGIFKFCKDSNWKELNLKGDIGERGKSGLNTLVKTVTESAGINCEFGGIKYLAGQDLKGNSILTDDEVESQAFLCNGAAGERGKDGYSSLLLTSLEPNGANCTNGGIKITTGKDNGSGTGGIAGDGFLQSSEITSTNYVCNGAQGQIGPSGNNGFNSLIKITAESAGANCPNAGRKIDTGVDSGTGGGTANDGILQSGEIQSTSYICNGTNGTDGFNSLVKISTEPAGSNCVSGGKKIESGLDNGASSGTARNGNLEAGEVASVQYLCNSPSFTVYDSANSRVGYYVSSISNYSVGISGYSSVISNGFILRDLTQNIYTIYDETQESNPLSVLNGLQASLPTEVYFESTNCSGQAYATQTELLQSNSVLNKFVFAGQPLYLAFYAYNHTAGNWYFVSDKEVVIGSLSAQTKNLKSRYDCPSSACNLVSDLVCQSSVSNGVDVIPVSLVTRKFESSLGSGWQISP